MLSQSLQIPLPPSPSPTTPNTVHLVLHLLQLTGTRTRWCVGVTMRNALVFVYTGSSAQHSAQTGKPQKLDPVTDLKGFEYCLMGDWTTWFASRILARDSPP